MKIGIIGANGFIGSAITEYLTQCYDVTCITKQNYNTLKMSIFDVLINANGNSKKYLADIEPSTDFSASVLSVFNSIHDFKFKRYIYLSSLDAHHFSIYGMNKRIAENVLYTYSYAVRFNLIVLRLGLVIGQGMKKGVVFDIENDNVLRVMSESKFQLITSTEVSKVVSKMLKCSNLSTLTYPSNICGSTSISVNDIAKLMNKKKLIIDKKADMQVYEHEAHDIPGVYSLKTSEQYLMDYLQ